MVFNIDNNNKKCQNKISIFLKDHRMLTTGVMAAEYSVLPSHVYYLGLCDIFDLITKRWCSVSLTVFLFNCLHTKSVLVTISETCYSNTRSTHQICKANK